jgi:hypothetical protein
VGLKIKYQLQKTGFINIAIKKQAIFDFSLLFWLFCLKIVWLIFNILFFSNV